MPVHISYLIRTEHKLWNSWMIRNHIETIWKAFWNLVKHILLRPFACSRRFFFLHRISGLWFFIWLPNLGDPSILPNSQSVTFTTRDVTIDYIRCAWEPKLVSVTVWCSCLVHFNMIFCKRSDKRRKAKGWRGHRSQSSSSPSIGTSELGFFIYLFYVCFFL